MIANNRISYSMEMSQEYWKNENILCDVILKFARFIQFSLFSSNNTESPADNMVGSQDFTEILLLISFYWFDSIKGLFYLGQHNP